MDRNGSTFISFRARFNNYKSSCRKFSSGVAVKQAEFFRHITEVNQHGFLEDVSFQIIDRVLGVLDIRKDSGSLDAEVQKLRLYV